MTHPSAKPCLGYPSRTAAIVALHAQGVDVAEIARRIGGTTTYVSVTLSRARQSSRHRQALGDEAVVQLRVPQDTANALQGAAQRRGWSVEQLALRLLATIAADRMADAVLDDRGGAA